MSVNTSVSPTLQVLVVEDHPMFVAALKQLIGYHFPAIEIYVAATLEDSIAWLRLTGIQPLAILCDLSLPDAQGTQVIQSLRTVTTSPLVVISADNTIDTQKLMLHCGVNEFIPKRADTSVLLGTLAKVFGLSPKPTLATEPVLNDLALTVSQSRVAKLLMQGHPNKEIARMLHLAPETIKTHVRDIMTKLDVRNRTEAVLKLLQARN